MTSLVHIRSGHVFIVSQDDPDRLALLQRYGYEVQVGNPGNPPPSQSPSASASPPPVPATPLASRAARAPSSSSTSLLSVGPIFAGCLFAIAISCLFNARHR